MAVLHTVPREHTVQLLEVLLQLPRGCGRASCSRVSSQEVAAAHEVESIDIILLRELSALFRYLVEDLLCVCECMFVCVCECVCVCACKSVCV